MLNPHGASARFALIFLLALAIIGRVAAQSPATGTIEGRVANLANGSYLENARITVEGTGR